MKSLFLYFIILLIPLNYGCDKVSNKDKILAKVYGKILNNSEIEYNFEEAVDSADSAALKNMFVEHWIRNQLLLHAAEISSKGKNTIDELTEKYENSLTIDYFKKNIIEQSLDSTISEQELLDYYGQVKSKFKLEEDVVNLKFIKLIADKQTINKIRQLWNSGNFKGITDYIHLNSEESALDNNFWLSKSELGKILPKSLIQDKASYDVQKNINGTEYFLKVTALRHKNEIIPLPLVKEEITALIIKKRKSDLIDSFIADLYKKETKNNKVKIYD